MVKLFNDEMPRIMANEYLGRAMSTAVGGGNMSEENLKETVRSWRSLSGARDEAIRPRDPAQHKAMLAAAGIVFEEVKK